MKLKLRNRRLVQAELLLFKTRGVAVQMAASTLVLQAFVVLLEAMFGDDGPAVYVAVALGAPMVVWLTGALLLAEKEIEQIPKLEAKIDLLRREVQIVYRKGIESGKKHAREQSTGAVRDGASEPEKAVTPDIDAAFRKVRQAFARLYHPDNLDGGTLEKVIREEVFKEFWRELEAIRGEEKG